MSRTYTPVAEVSFERLGGEIIVIQFESGRYYSLTGTAADIFTLIEERVPSDSWRKIIHDHYNVEITDAQLAEEIEAHVNRLLEAQLIQESSEPPNRDFTRLPGDMERASWVAPQIYVDSDLTDLLTIDPIHDVDATGWPSTDESQE